MLGVGGRYDIKSWVSSVLAFFFRRCRLVRSALLWRMPIERPIAAALDRAWVYHACRCGNCRWGNGLFVGGSHAESHFEVFFFFSFEMLYLK